MITDVIRLSPSAPVHTALFSQNLTQNLTWNEAFRKFSLRLQATRAKKTQRYAAVCAKAFFRWCQKNDIIERSLLAD